MLSRRPSLAIALAAGSLLLALATAHAGPTVIRDEMLRDTAVTPALGRGYSIATNTFQSICLVDIPQTKPSFDFKYEMKILETDSAGKVKHVMSEDNGAEWLRVAYEHVETVSYQRTTSSQTTETTTKHTHYVLVTLEVDAYYSSLDEAQGKLSAPAIQLLTSNDVPGFLEACGLYYTRSLTRHTVLVSIFSYETDTVDRDVQFETELKTTIQAWQTNQTDQPETPEARNFKTKADKQQLTITTMGFGLAKNVTAGLVVYTLDEFRDAVRQALLLAQDPAVGRVTSIEVVPWLESPIFQQYVGLPPDTIPEGPGLTPVTLPGVPPSALRVAPTAGKRVSGYAQKRILTQNSEFITEMDRAARGKLNHFYRLKRCKAAIELDYMIADPANPTVRVFRDHPDEPRPPIDGKPDPRGGSWGDRLFVSNRDATKRMALKHLYGRMSPQQLAVAFMEYEAFVYGGSGKPVSETKLSAAQRAELRRTAFQTGNYPRNLFPGAAQCAADLARMKFRLVLHRQLTSCARVEEAFVVVGSSVLNDFCMPRPYEPDAPLPGTPTDPYAKATPAADGAATPAADAAATPAAATPAADGTATAATDESAAPS